MDVKELAKEVQEFKDNNPSPPVAEAPNLPVPPIVPPVTPPTTEAKVETPASEEKHEVVLSIPKEAEVKLSKEDEEYLNSLETPVKNGEEKIQKEIPKGEVKKEDVLTDDDPQLIKDLREVIKKGGDVNSFLKEIASDVNDLSKEQVMERYLKNKYGNELTAEEIQESIEDTFGANSTLSKIEQKEKLLEMRKAVNSSQQEKAKKYVSSLPDNSKNVEQEKARVADIAQKATVELDGMKEQYVGKRFMGMTFTEDMWKEVSDSIKEGDGFAFPIMKEGKFQGFDLKESIEYNAFRKFRNDILKANIALGEIKGYNKLYAQRKRVSTEETSGTPIPEGTVEQAYEQAQKKGFKHTGTPAPYLTAAETSKAK